MRLLLTVTFLASGFPLSALSGYAAALPARDSQNAAPGPSQASLTRISGAGHSGTGVVVAVERDRATIVTASHVIAGAATFSVVFAAAPDAPPFAVTSTDIVGMQSDEIHGLAAFRVRGTIPPGVQPATLDTETLRVGTVTEPLTYWGFPNMSRTVRRLSGYLSGTDGTLLVLDRPAGEGASGGALVRKDRVVGLVTSADAQFTYAVAAPVIDVALRGWGIVAGDPSPRPSRTPDLIVTLHRIAVVDALCPGGDELSLGFGPVLDYKRSGFRGETRPNLSRRFRDVTTIRVGVEDCDSARLWFTDLTVTRNETGSGIVSQRVTVGDAVYDVSYSVDTVTTDRGAIAAVSQIKLPFQGRRVCEIDEDGSVIDCFDSLGACEKDNSLGIFGTCRTAPAASYCFEYEDEQGRRRASCHLTRAQCEGEWNATPAVRTYCVEVPVARQ